MNLIGFLVGLLVIIVGTIYVGNLGDEREIGSERSVILSLLTSPFIALIIVLLSKKKDTAPNVVFEEMSSNEFVSNSAKMKQIIATENKIGKEQLQIRQLREIIERKDNEIIRLKKTLIEKEILIKSLANSKC